ncbi:MAG: chemotaxis protein CheX [Desulfopila sp.]|nr:chemotaxis protein CheX [Desulfopila sp.]
MIFLDIEEADAEEYEQNTPEFCLSSMLGFGGDIRGSIELHFPRETAVAITSQFLGMDVMQIDEDVKDAMGELANMIAGGLKAFFAEKNVKAELAIPTTVIGKAYSTRSIPGAERVQIYFVCGTGIFLADMKYVCNS